MSDLSQLLHRLADVGVSRCLQQNPDFVYTLSVAAWKEDAIDTVLELVDTTSCAGGSVGQGVARLLFYEALLGSRAKREAPSSFRNYCHGQVIAPEVSQLALRLHSIFASTSENSSSKKDDEAESTSVMDPASTSTSAEEKDNNAMEEIEGFLMFFATKTSSYFDPALSAITEFTASLVAAAAASSSSSSSLQRPTSRNQSVSSSPSKDVVGRGQDTSPQRDSVLRTDKEVNADDSSVIRVNDEEEQDARRSAIVQQLRRLFLLLYSIQCRFLIPSHAAAFAHSFELAFRLILQYHDPLLSVHFDHHQVDIGTHANRWIRSIFALLPSQDKKPSKATLNTTNGTCSSSLRIMAVWDWLFSSTCVDEDDPHFGLLMSVFISVVALIEQRQELLRCSTAASVVAWLDGFHVSDIWRADTSPDAAASAAGTPPVRLSPSSSVVPSFTMLPPCYSVKDLIKKARVASRNTPSSAKQMLRGLLFPDAQEQLRDPQEVRETIKSYVALSVDAEELGSVFASPSPIPTASDCDTTTTAGGANHKDSSSSGGSAAVVGRSSSSSSSHHHHHQVSYVILDCRSQDSFNFARLPTALHVGDAIGFDAELLQKMRQRFEAAKGSHLCVLGTGRTLVEEVNLIKLILLHLVQNGFPYVSVAAGGFKALIPLIKAGKVEYVKGNNAVKAGKRGGGGGTSDNKQRHVDPSSPHRGTDLSCIPRPPHDSVGDVVRNGPPRQNDEPSAPSETISGTSATRELAAKADVLRQKATSWGWGVMQAFQGKLESITTTTVAKSGPSESSTKSEEASTAADEVVSSSHVEVVIGPTDAASPPAVSSSTTPPAADPHSSRQIFTVAGSSHNDEDDELELITTLPEEQSITATPKQESKGSSELPQSGTKKDVTAAADHHSPPSAVAAAAVKAHVIDDDELEFLYTSPQPAKPLSAQQLTPAKSASSAAARGASSSLASAKGRSVILQHDALDDLFD